MMKSTNPIKRFSSVALTALSTLMVAMPALAQEGESTAATAPQGVTILILMLGIAAILFVGIYHIGQTRPPNEGGEPQA